MACMYFRWPEIRVLVLINMTAEIRISFHFTERPVLSSGLSYDLLVLMCIMCSLK